MADKFTITTTNEETVRDIVHSTVVAKNNVLYFLNRKLGKSMK